MSLLAKPRVPKEYLGAFKVGHRHASREFIDEELSVELLNKTLSGCEKSREALEWLTRFNNEYHKGVVKKKDTEALHNTEELRLDCYRREYSARYDLFTYVKKIGNVEHHH